MIGERRRVKIDPSLRATLRFDLAVIGRKHCLFAQSGQTAVRQAQDDTQRFVKQMRGACIQEHLSSRVDADDAPFRIEHDQRAGHRRNQRLGRRTRRNRRQAAARESHGS